MNVKDVKILAKKHGIKSANKNKIDLIRTIQLEEGYFDCFATAYEGICDQTRCLWRDDCFKTAKLK